MNQLKVIFFRIRICQFKNKYRLVKNFKISQKTNIKFHPTIFHIKNNNKKIIDSYR